MLHREMLVNGVFLGGPCDQGTGKQLIRSPWDHRVVGTAAEGAWPEADAALDSARAAGEEWGLPERAGERASLLKRIAGRLREDRDELAELMADEIGKPVTLGRAELDRAALTFDLSADAALAADPVPDLGPDPRAGGFAAILAPFPVGVVLAITPYNWPFNLAAHKLGPALASGCTVVLKGSPKASLCTLALARIFHECGTPPGVVNALNVDDRTAARLVADGRIDAISFTGSPAVGWRVFEAAGRRPVTLELGGNAAALVDAVARPWTEVAEELAASAFGYAGQVCISLQHVIATPAVAEDLRAALILATDRIAVADPRDPKAVCGPMIDESAAVRLAAMVESSGGKILAGGTRDRNRFVPTLVELPLAADVPLMREEAFGPVLTFSVAPDADAGLAWMADHASGIHASVYADDPAVLDLARRRLRVGGIVLDAPPSMRFDALPYGGEGASGWGREGIGEAMRFYRRPRTWVQRKP